MSKTIKMALESGLCDRFGELSSKMWQKFKYFKLGIYKDFACVYGCTSAPHTEEYLELIDKVISKVTFYFSDYNLRVDDCFKNAVRIFLIVRSAW